MAGHDTPEIRTALSIPAHCCVYRALFVSVLPRCRVDEEPPTILSG